MNTVTALQSIKAALQSAPKKSYVAELNLQIIKYASDLENISGREFCEAVGIANSYAVEFSTMRKIASRLRAAGLDVSKI